MKVNGIVRKWARRAIKAAGEEWNDAECSTWNAPTLDWIRFEKDVKDASDYDAVAEDQKGKDLWFYDLLDLAADDIRAEKKEGVER